jgi:hypothetical protein
MQKQSLYIAAFIVAASPAAFAEEACQNVFVPRSNWSATQDNQRWLGKFEQRAKWNFCLTAAMVAADQERR